MYFTATWAYLKMHKETAVSLKERDYVTFDPGQTLRNHTYNPASFDRDRLGLLYG